MKRIDHHRPVHVENKLQWTCACTELVTKDVHEENMSVKTFLYRTRYHKRMDVEKIGNQICVHVQKVFRDQNTYRNGRQRPVPVDI